MKKEMISTAIGDISTRYIKEAAYFMVEKNSKHLSWWVKRIAPIVACLVLTFVIIIAFESPIPSPIQIKPQPEVDSSIQMDNTNTNSDVLTVPQDTSILYSELALSDDMANEEILSHFQGSEMDILPFDESMLSDCTAILEGKITNMYLKQYDVVTANDKFSKDGRLNWNIKTVIYELQITKSWYGNSYSTQTILIEDQTFFQDEVFSMKVGHKYVIPIYEAGNVIYTTHHEYISGNIKRDSTFSTFYPFHPQIEVTEDNAYIVSTNWPSLTAENDQKIIMDVELGNVGSYYKDRMVLIDSESFERRMEVLVEGIK